MNILVTGGCGLIGHNVVQRLERDGHRVLNIDTLTDYGIIPRDELEYLMRERMALMSTLVHPTCITSPEIFKIMSYFQPEVVIHLASFPRQKVVNANPQVGAAVMSVGLLNLL